MVKMYLITFNSECQEIEVWLTDQNSKLLEINLTLVIREYM